MVNNVSDIGASKISAFEDRAAIKDIIDLYYLARHLSWSQLFTLADTKRVPVAYEHLLTIHQEGVTGQALITHPLPSAELRRFLDELTQAVEAEVKKKEQAKMATVGQWLPSLLWDFPHEQRGLNIYAIPVLERRMKMLPLPEKLALTRLLQSAL